MKLEILQNKAKIVGNLMGKKVRVSAWGRKYRVDMDEDSQEQGIFTIAYLPAQDLWNRLDFAQTALEKLHQTRDAALATANG
jgi:hypothetical protein